VISRLYSSQAVVDFGLGDVQPYVALGKKLKADGHRVRIGTHETFHNFVTDGGLEFYPIGGDPQELMSYMVKSILPGQTFLDRKLTILLQILALCPASSHSRTVTLVESGRCLRR